MSLPKGNYVALQPLQPVKSTFENKIPDLATAMIDNLIKEKKAAEAARVKTAIDQGKTMFELSKDIKAEPIQTIPALQEYNNNMMNKVIEAKSRAAMIAMDTSVPLAEKQRAYIMAANMEAGYKQVGTFLGDKDQVKAFMEMLNTQDATVFQGDKKLALMNALKMNALKVEFNDNGIPVVKYKGGDDKLSDDDREMSFAEFTQKMLNPFEKDTYRELSKDMDDMAKGMVEERTSGIGGNRFTESSIFNRKDAFTKFDSMFGTWNIDSPDVNPYLKHYAYRVLNKGEIKNEDDWNKVREAFADDLDTRVKSVYSAYDKYTPAQMLGQNLKNQETQLDIDKKRAEKAAGYLSLRGGGEGGSSGMENGSAAGMTYSAANQDVYVQVPTGNNKNPTVVKQQPMRILTLPKLKGQPSTENVFGVTKYRNKNGHIVDAYYVGKPAEDGRIVTTRVDGKELDSYFVKLGYNPITAKAYLYSQNTNQDNPDVPFIGSGQKVKHYNIPKYTKPIFFKTDLSKTVETDEFK